MMNQVVLLEPGYLEAVRELTRKHDIILIFDEVKTGLCIAPGGATDCFGVLPDMVTLKKTLGGGLPPAQSAARKRSSRWSRTAASTRWARTTGTRWPWPRPCTAFEVLTPGAYEHLDALNDRILAGCQKVIDDHWLPGYAVGVGAKGCVTFSPTKIVDYETYKESQDGELADLAWLYNMNRGVFMTPGREEEWTLSVVHSSRTATRSSPPSRRWPRI